LRVAVSQHRVGQQNEGLQRLVSISAN
jgi:hypothetical protein